MVELTIYRYFVAVPLRQDLNDERLALFQIEFAERFLTDGLPLSIQIVQRTNFVLEKVDRQRQKDVIGGRISLARLNMHLELSLVRIKSAANGEIFRWNHESGNAGQEWNRNWLAEDNK